MKDCDWQPQMIPYEWYWKEEVIVGGVSFFVGQNKKDSCRYNIGAGYPSEIDSIYFIKDNGIWKLTRKNDPELCIALKDAPEDYNAHQGGPQCY